MAPDPLILPSGTQLAGFTIQDVVGIGGMAVVYRARQESLGRTIALKVLSSQLAHDETFRERFRREAALVAALDHPSLVPVYEFGDDDDRQFIAMRYVAGGTLADLLRTGGLSASEALQLLGAIGSALDRAHGSGVLHRDVKPQNILLSEDGFPYLADFGIARTEASELTEPGGFLGSVAYVAPELIKGNAPSAQSDIYALAVVAYECITGAGPYAETDGGALIDAHLHHEPVPLEPIDDPLVQRVDAALRLGVRKDHTNRPATAMDFVESLRGAFDRAGAERLAMRPAFPAAHRIARALAPEGDFPEPAQVTAVIVGGAALGVAAGQPPGPSFLETGVFRSRDGEGFVFAPPAPELPKPPSRAARLRHWWPAIIAVASLLLPAVAYATHDTTPASTKGTLQALSFDVPKDSPDGYHVSDAWEEAQTALDGLQPSLVVTSIIGKGLTVPNATFGTSLMEPSLRKAFPLAPRPSAQQPQGRLVAVRGGTVQLYQVGKADRKATLGSPPMQYLAVAQAGDTVVLAGCYILGRNARMEAMCVNAMNSLVYRGRTLNGAPIPAVANALATVFVAIQKVRGDAFTETEAGPRRARATAIANAYVKAASDLAPLARTYPHDGEIATIRILLAQFGEEYRGIADATTKASSVDKAAVEGVATLDRRLATQLYNLEARGYRVQESF